MVKRSTDADTRRKDDTTEESKHFINLDDPIFKSKVIPNNWELALIKYSAESLKACGTLPSEIAKTKIKLTKAFQNKDKELIILYSSDLGHYIADACVPLHTTINYDGQLTNQTGLHGLWETECPQLFINEYLLKQSAHTKYIKNVDLEIWKAL